MNFNDGLAPLTATRPGITIKAAVHRTRRTDCVFVWVFHRVSGAVLIVLLTFQLITGFFQASYANSVPEKRKVKYALIETGKAEAAVQVTQDDLRAYYDQHREQYRMPEQVKVSHILIKTPLPGTDGKVDEKGVAEAQHRAEDLLKQLKGGAKLEDLAKKYSEDLGSGKVGGSLGWLGKGQTVPEFEKTAFSLPKGQISDLVKSSYGFHIIRVDDKQAAHMKTLDEVKAEIEPILKHQKAQQVAQKQAEDLLKRARSPQGLDAAADAGLRGLLVDRRKTADSADPSRVTSLASIIDLFK